MVKCSKKPCRNAPQNALEPRQNTSKHKMQWSDMNMRRYPLILQIFIHSGAVLNVEDTAVNGTGKMSLSLYSSGMIQVVNCKLVKRIDSMENNKMEKEKEECQMILTLHC